MIRSTFSVSCIIHVYVLVASENSPTKMADFSFHARTDRRAHGGQVNGATRLAPLRRHDIIPGKFSCEQLTCGQQRFFVQSSVNLSGPVVVGRPFDAGRKQLVCQAPLPPPSPLSCQLLPRLVLTSTVETDIWRHSCLALSQTGLANKAVGQAKTE
ncbi:hypothetical protein BaRGS_00020399, partial [Batillaria attramentaria]